MKVLVQSLPKAANRLFCPDLVCIIERGRFLEVTGAAKTSNLH